LPFSVFFDTIYVVNSQEVSEWSSNSTGSFRRPYFVLQTFSRHRCKPTETDYCEISHWVLQTVLQHQDSGQWKTGKFCLSLSCQLAL